MHCVCSLSVNIGNLKATLILISVAHQKLFSFIKRQNNNGQILVDICHDGKHESLAKDVPVKQKVIISVKQKLFVELHDPFTD